MHSLISTHLCIQHKNDQTTIVFPTSSCSPTHLNIFTTAYPTIYCSIKFTSRSEKYSFCWHINTHSKSFSCKKGN
uniref:Ovule protein n=1 Tax=Meloidogyne incognita TaxID=6306 RepID=A0A914L0V4_MELIC